MSEKDELREHALLHLEKMRPEHEDVEATAALFRDNVPLKDGAVVAAYWPFQNEFDVRYIVEDVLSRGFTVALPIVSGTSREMTFAKWDGKSGLVKGRYGIFIPPEEDLVEPDVLVIPMLAFDRKGNRLGRGAGHYDATIAALRKKKDILAIGVAYASQAVLFNLPAEEHDQKMDMIITPNGVQNFKN